MSILFKILIVLLLLRWAIYDLPKILEASKRYKRQKRYRDARKSYNPRTTLVQTRAGSVKETINEEDS